MPPIEEFWEFDHTALFDADWDDPGSGKSGGARVCYAFFPHHGKVLLVTAFGKSEKVNLSTSEKRELADLLKRYADRLDK